MAETRSAVERHDEVNAEKAKGGFARAEALPAKRRTEIARQAAMTRWNAEIPQATHEGEFPIGESIFSAAVLPNGKRLLTQSTFMLALGRSRTPKAGTGVLSTVDGTPFFLQAETLKPFIDDELRASTTPIFFLTKSGKRAVGYEAELLPKVAEVYLKMRDACARAEEPIPRQYVHIVDACDMVMRGLARVGVVALVDEATGYQEVRDRLALQAILDKYLRTTFAAWAKRFPDEFYQQIFRLRKWEWKGMKVNRPQVVAHYTKDLVWSRLAPGILRELEARNPKDEKGVRKHRHHQLLTEEVGNPALGQHLYAIVGLMRISDTWDQFMKMTERAYPRYKESADMPLFLDVPGVELQS